MSLGQLKKLYFQDFGKLALLILILMIVEFHMQSFQ